MSQTCPLCGKTKSEEALFCDNCTKKIHTEYEVNIPEEIVEERISSTEDLPVKEELSGKFGDSESDIKFQESDTKIGLEQVSEEEEVVLESEAEMEFEEKDPEPGMESEPDMESYYKPEFEPQKVLPKGKKVIRGPLLFILVVALLTGAFFVYNATIRKNNLDRSAWAAAVKTNSVEGYLAYIEAHPQGAYFDDAQSGLRRLKSEEVALWERMKETDNVAELRGFLEQHSDSPYAPLVKTRLDSLIWIGALQRNTLSSYSDYIGLAENGSIGGDYIAEAQRRYELLSMPQTADTIAHDGIFETPSSSEVPLQ